MSYKQLVDPNLNLSEDAGLCLQFSRRTYGAPKVEDTAYEAFENTKFRHYDRDFPSDVSVPVWFEWWGNIKWSDGINRYARYDHVAVRAANGIIYSSPLAGRGQARFNSIEELERAFGAGMKYYAWTEDISNVRVVEEADMPLSKEARDKLFGAFFFRIPPEGDNGYVGMDANQVIMELDGSKERAEIWKRYNPNRLTTLEGQVRDLQDKVNKMPPIKDMNDGEAAKKLEDLKKALNAIIKEKE